MGDVMTGTYILLATGLIVFILAIAMGATLHLHLKYNPRAEPQSAPPKVSHCKICGTLGHRQWCPNLCSYRQTAPVSALAIAETLEAADLKSEYGHLYPEMFWNAFLKRIPCEQCLWPSACILCIGDCAGKKA